MSTAHPKGSRPRPTRIDQPWGERTAYGPGEDWPVRVDTHLADGVREEDVDRWVQTASILHSNGDAMDMAVVDGRIQGVRGRAGDRVNHGRLGVKDLYGWQANSSPDRLTRPLVRENGQLVETDWDTAMDRVVGRTRELLDEQGASAIGFYTSGQLFAEEYYTLGVIVLYGHNMAETQSVLWMRILDRLAGPNPPAILCVDPRRTPVAAHATLHLAPLPGTNMALMNALIHELIESDAVDRDYVEISTPRGRVRATVRITDIRDGVLFLPFHYGYWDTPTGDGPARDAAGRAANELTLTDWDPVSKQPIFKTAAARITRVADSAAAAEAHGPGHRESRKEGAR
ncbi:molybdopterin-dependent oxidoreductase [Dietzia sp. NPDC055343]